MPQGPPPYVDLIHNGDFSDGMTSWLSFATPDMGHIVTQFSNDMLEFYREAQHDGRANQAVVFQWTDTPLPLRAPVVASFDLGNSSTARKRIAVLIHEDEFSDLYACTFWLEPGAPMRRYTMRSHTTKAWHNATIAFYAASSGSDGGFYQVDNVTLMYDPWGPDDSVLCEDPTTPAPPGGPYSTTLLKNGHFYAGLEPWAVFHRLTWQLIGDVFQFIWLVDAPPFDDCHPIPELEPAPVIIQTTGVRIPAGDVLTAHIELGNSSPVRKRVSLLLHQWDFTDLSACSFWLEPNTPLQTYAMRMHTTTDWSDAAFSVYAATRGPETWIEMDNAVLMRTPSTPTVGTECWGPIFPPAVSNLRPTVNGGFSQRAADQGRVNRRGAVPSAGSEIAGETARLPFTGRVLSYLVPPDTRVLAFEVSSDGETWETVMFLEPSEDWRTVTIDWSQLTSPVFYFRVTGS